jgi:hypothetical protein
MNVEGNPCFSLGFSHESAKIVTADNAGLDFKNVSKDVLGGGKF